MNEKSKNLFVVFTSLISILIAQIIYLDNTKGINDKERSDKLNFVRISSLPDLAISTETTYIRHRSLSDLFSIYKDDPALREYFPSTFVYNHSSVLNKKGMNIE